VVNDDRPDPFPTLSAVYGGVSATIHPSRNTPSFRYPPDAGVPNPCFICVRSGTPICGQEDRMSSQSRGSRLPDDSESNDRHRTEERAEGRLGDELGRRFASFVDEHGEHKSDVVREALDEFLPSSERSRYVLPRDPELADAYVALAGDERRKIAVDVAEDILCRESHPNTPKELVRQEVLEPLTETGLIAVEYGTVAVHPLTTRTEVSDGE